MERIRNWVVFLFACSAVAVFCVLTAPLWIVERLIIWIKEGRQ